MSSTNLLNTKIMNNLLKNTTFTPPTTLYAALFTTSPNVSGTGGIEVSTSSTGYARVPIVSSSANWSGPDAALAYVTINETTFGVPTANWGTVVGVGFYSASTGGDLYFVSSLVTARTINSGEGAPKFVAGAIKINPA